MNKDLKCLREGNSNEIQNLSQQGLKIYFNIWTLRKYEDNLSTPLKPGKVKVQGKKIV